MEVLKPPTDTIYKFLAIFGLLIFLSSLSTPIWMFQKLDTLRAEHLRDLEILNLDATTWEEAWEEVRKASEAHTAASKRVQETFDNFAKSKSQASKTTVQNALTTSQAAYENFELKSREFEEKVLKWRKQHAEVSYKTDLVEISEHTVELTARYCLLGMLAGLAMTITGFILWYKRTQKMEDLILKKKAESDEPPASPA
jgi:hypothetical protein